MHELLNVFFDQLQGQKWQKCPDRMPNSSSCVTCQSSQYFNGNRVDYSCVEKRKLYVLRYLPVHVAENRSALKLLPAEALSNILRYREVRILSIGGGPGSDLYAALEFLSEKISDDCRHLIEITRVDIEPLWDEMAEAVIGEALNNCDVDSSIKNIHADIALALDKLKHKEFDLIMCSYIISELQNVNFIDLGKQLQKLLWKGGALLITDRPQTEISASIREIFKGAGIEFSELFNSAWAGYSYDNEIAEQVKPKFLMSSNIFVGVKN